MSPALREQVRRRAGNRCEYCRIRQEHEGSHPFHVEHINPRKHGGSDDVENLAFACHHCNLSKGTNLTGRDPDTNEIVRLFDPDVTNGTNTSSSMAVTSLEQQMSGEQHHGYWR